MTAPNSLVDRLGAHIRSDQRDDASFERVARGEATADERARLERAAAADPAVARRLDGSMPLGQAVADQIAARLRPKKSAPVLRIASRLGAAPLALAAAALLFLTVGRRSEVELPEYAVDARGVELERGPTDSSGRLHVSRAAGALFEIVLRPQTAPGAAVSAWLFTSGDGVAPLVATVEVSTAGAVRVAGAVASLGTAREIVAVVAPPSAVRSAADAAKYAATRAGGRGVRVLVVPIDR